MEVTTMKRMRINISKTSKGYSFETTYEVQTDGDLAELSGEMEAGLMKADRLACSAIARRELADAVEADGQAADGGGAWK